MEKDIKWSNESTIKPSLYKVMFDGYKKLGYLQVDSIEDNPNTKKIIIFPGSSEGATRNSSSENAVINLLKLLSHYKISLDFVEIYSTTYFHPYPKERTLQNVESLKKDPSNWFSEDAEFISNYFLKIISNNGELKEGEFIGSKKSLAELENSLSSITFFGKSKGTLMCREVENCLKYLMKEKYNYSDIEIKSSLKELFAVGIANIYISDIDERLSRGVYFTSTTDTKASKYFPNFENIVRLQNPDKTRIKFKSHDHGRTTLAVVNIPKELKLIDDIGNTKNYTDENVHSFLSYLGIRENPKDNTIAVSVANLILHGITREPRNILDNNLSLLINSFIEVSGKDGISSHLIERINSKTKVMIWAESLVGSGHINYVGAVGNILSKKGYDVTLVSGSKKYKMSNFEIPGVKVINLPGVYADYDSKTVFSENNIQISNDTLWQERYKNQLLEALDGIKPNIFISEFWPIRRGDFDFALLPFMDKLNDISPNCHSHCLLRDYVHMSVTNTGSGGNDISAAETFLNKFKGNLLVHSVKEILKIEESLDNLAVQKLEKATKYIGYIVPRFNNKETGFTTRDLVLVTCGGSWNNYCEKTTLSIIKSLKDPKNEFYNNKSLILLPKDTNLDSLDKIRELTADSSISIENNRNDFLQLMKRAKAIFSHGGNTIVEAIDSNVPNIYVTPRMDDGELIKEDNFYKLANGVNKEQLARSASFANAGYICLIEPNELDNLVDKINDFSTKKRWVQNFALSKITNGAEVASHIIENKFLIENPGLSIKRNSKNIS
jgi:predicted glycosyltransferase